MYFKPTEYTKSCRIGTRCNVGEVVKLLGEYPDELRWLRRNEQFKHVLHMPVEANHQVQGMWMLMVRTAKQETKECWFVVNGTPIRYSIREHALLTGLNCKEYPPNWENLGSFAFAKRVFKKTKGIKISTIEKEMERLKKKKKRAADRMKLVVLYFIAKVLKAKNKYDPTVDPFLLRIVDDLSVCETFPWGRYTFNDCVDGMKWVVDNMKGAVKTQTGLSAFIIPPEILAFECIPNLRRRFREDVGGAHPGCPRMCKRRFVKGDNKGFPLQHIHDALGDTTEIESILEPTEEERGLLRQIVEVDAEEGMGYIDLVVESWRERLVVQKKPIFWKELHKKDVEARSLERIDEDLDVGVGEKEKCVEHPESLRALQAVLVGVIEEGFGKLQGAVGEMNARVVGEIEKGFEKLKVLETTVNTLHGYMLGKRMVVTGEGINSDKSFILMSPIEECTPVVPTSPTQEEDNCEEGDLGAEKDKEEKTQKEVQGEEKDKEEKKKSKVKRKRKEPVRFTPEETKRKKK